MLLIATDEAGYGPKLGPLVITGTAWRIPGEITVDELARVFEPLSLPQVCAGVTVVVNDSKAVYSSNSGLDSLHAVVSACLHWCGRPETSLSQILPIIAKTDASDVDRVPWLQQLGDGEFLAPEETSDLRTCWQQTGLELLDVQSRVITAGNFNTACQTGNKADLLSESTLGLVRDLLPHATDQESVQVYCDRHGGRRYYGGVLQHVFPDSTLQMITESKPESSYQMNENDHSIQIRFTVKGDSFTPVAMSSLHAKYLRERFMQSLNGYFADLHTGSQLKPTAGYPVDADRFLDDIAPILKRAKIDRERLVRAR